MKAALFILVVVLILMVWTAVRYRKQITGIIRFIRMIREAASPAAVGRSDVREMKASAPNELVSCSKCGVWVPRDRAIRFDATTYYCSKECVAASLTAN